MSALAAVTLRRQGAPGLLVAYADAVAGLPIGPDGKRQRRNAAALLLAIYPALEQWMARPTPARLADIHRTGAWTFLAWCFTEGHLRPDLDLLLAKLPGRLYQAWSALHPGDTPRIAGVAGRFGWSANWTRDVSGGGLALICLTAGKSLDGLSDDDFAVFARDLAAAPSAEPHTWTHNSSRAFSLHQACYELRICQQPPRQARPGKASLEQRAQHITQPAIRKAALRYLTGRWFGLLTDQRLRRGTHKSVQALEKDIRDWIRTWNDDPRPFTWTKTADEILERLAAYLQRIPGGGH